MVSGFRTFLSKLEKPCGKVILSHMSTLELQRFLKELWEGMDVETFFLHKSRHNFLHNHSFPQSRFHSPKHQSFVIFSAATRRLWLLPPLLRSLGPSVSKFESPPLFTQLAVTHSTRQRTRQTERVRPELSEPLGSASAGQGLPSSRGRTRWPTACLRRAIRYPS